jgi:hypothetical protein
MRPILFWQRQKELKGVTLTFNAIDVTVMQHAYVKSSAS